MLRDFEKKLTDHNLIDLCNKLVVAVSGGPDSMVLLNLFSRLSKRLKFVLTVAHVNHGLRGKSSDAEETLVKKIAKKYGLPIHTVRWKTPAKGNIQNAARKFRYDFFKDVAFKTNSSAVATAHHRDDQAETVLLQFIRGSGIKGLGGIPWITKYKNIQIIHPLLDFGRDQIEAYARRHKIHFACDESNLKTGYRRNFIRHKLVPLLEEINPRVKESIADAAFTLQDSFKAMDSIAKTFADEYFTALDKKITWNRAPFTRLPTAIRRFVLIEAFERLTGGRVDLNSDQIEHMELISLSPKMGGRYMLPKGAKFCRTKDLLLISNP